MTKGIAYFATHRGWETPSVRSALNLLFQYMARKGPNVIRPTTMRDLRLRQATSR
jgi:hypothetical protein